MTITPDMILSRSHESAWRKIDGQVAVISIDVNRVRLLNGVGSFVWERCDGVSIGSLVDAVCGAFSVDREQASRDVQTFVSDLASRGMVTVSPPSPEVPR